MNYLVEVEKAKEAKGGSGRGRESEGGVEGESVGETEALGRDEGTGEEGSEGGVEGRDGGGGNGNGRGEGERDRGGDRGSEEGRGRDMSKLTKMSYAVTAKTTASAIALHVGGQSSLTKVLLVCVVICNLLGFICCMTAVLLNYRRPRVAGILGGIGSISAALGFILLIVVFIPGSLV